MNTFEKVVHKAIHKQALNSAVRDLSADDLIVLKRNPNLIDAAVLDKIKDEITEYKDDQIIHAERNEMIDIVLGIIDKYRNEVSE